MYTSVLDRMFGAIRVVPIIAAFFIVSFYVEFRSISAFIGFEDYFRILLSRLLKFGGAALAVILLHLAAAIALDGKSHAYQVKFLKTPNIILTIFVIAFGILNYLDISVVFLDIKDTSFVNKTNIYTFIQFASVYLISIWWIFFRARSRQSGNPMTKADFIDSKLDAGLVFIFFISALFDPPLIHAQIKQREPVTVDTCGLSAPKMMIRYFNTSNGIVFADGAKFVFIPYDCLKSVEF